MLTRSLVGESLGATVEAVCPGVPPTDEFPLQVCVRQGGVESPWCFNHVVWAIVAARQAQLMSTGTRTSRLGSVPLLGWADNIIFLGDSIETTQRTIGEITKGMLAKGMGWKPSAMAVMRVGPLAGRAVGKHRLDNDNDVSGIDQPDDSTRRLGVDNDDNSTIRRRRLDDLARDSDDDDGDTDASTRQSV